MAAIMIPLKTLKDKSLFTLLYQIDQNLAEQTRSHGCPHCGGPLHYANYQRKPRGGPPDLEEKFEVRFSLCCGAKGCRHRILPPSVRFWDRRVYWAPVVLLVAALRQLKNRNITLERIKSICGALRSTVNRWRDYFQNIFPQSINYRRLAGHHEFDASSEPVIHNLLEKFFSTCREPKTALSNCLQALAQGP